VEEARSRSGLLADGTFADLARLQGLKSDILLIDGDVPEPILEVLTGAGSLRAVQVRTVGGLISGAEAREGTQELLELHAATASSVEQQGRRFQALLHSGRRPVVAKDLKKEELMDLMLQAKVVLDWCMRGTERTPIEASLYGAVVLTNDCDTGGDAVDFPLDGVHRVRNLDTAYFQRQMADWATNVMMPGQVALRRKYASEVTREGMAAAAKRWLETL